MSDIGARDWKTAWTLWTYHHHWTSNSWCWVWDKSRFPVGEVRTSKG